MSDILFLTRIRFPEILDSILDFSEEEDWGAAEIEDSLTSNLKELLGRDVFPAGSQLLNLRMYGSDIDLATAVKDDNDKKWVINKLKHHGYSYEIFADGTNDFLFGISMGEFRGIKVDIQLRSESNIKDLGEQISSLPKMNEKSIRRFRREKLLMKAIGGAKYVNWKHDQYRRLVPALIEAKPRFQHEMCRGEDPNLGGMCTHRATEEDGLCNFHLQSD